MSECRARECGRVTQEFLCSACCDALADALDQAPWLLDELTVTEQRQDRVSRGLRSGSAPRSPLLFDVRANALRVQLVTALTGWTRHLCETRGIAYRGGSTPDAAATWLRENVHAAALDEAAGEIHHDITTAVEAALATINPAPRRRYRGPCPNIVGRTPSGAPVTCGTPLYATTATEVIHTSSSTSGDDERPATFVTCPGCGVLHDTARLEASMLARSDRVPLDVVGLVRVLAELGEPVPRNTIDQWIHRGRLQPCGWRHDGQVVAHRASPSDKPVYQLGAARRLRAANPRGRTA